MIYKITRTWDEYIINTEFITHTHLKKNDMAYIYVIGDDEPIKVFEHEYREIEKELIKLNHKFLYENETRELK